MAGEVPDWVLFLVGLCGSAMIFFGCVVSLIAWSDQCPDYRRKIAAGMVLSALGMTSLCLAVEEKGKACECECKCLPEVPSK